VDESQQSIRLGVDEMAIDLETRKWLNFLHGSPDFVLKDTDDGGAEVSSPELVPSRDGIYWVHGRVILKNGLEVESVFHLDTDSGGEHHEVFWLVREVWYNFRDSRVRELLGGAEEIFPFSWEYSVPLEYDAHV
jgi:hypothetical protein